MEAINYKFSVGILDEDTLFDKHSPESRHCIYLRFRLLEMDLLSKIRSFTVNVKKIGEWQRLFADITWLQSGRIADNLDLNVLPASVHSWKFSNIALQNQWHMGDDSLQSVCQQILHHPVPNVNSDIAGTWLWSRTRDGSFTFSSAWDWLDNQLRNLSSIGLVSQP